MNTPFPDSVPDGVPLTAPSSSTPFHLEKEQKTLIVHASSPAKVIKFHSTNK